MSRSSASSSRRASVVLGMDRSVYSRTQSAYNAVADFDRLFSQSSTPKSNRPTSSSSSQQQQQQPEEHFGTALQRWENEQLYEQHYIGVGLIEFTPSKTSRSSRTCSSAVSTGYFDPAEDSC